MSRMFLHKLKSSFLLYCKQRTKKAELIQPGLSFWIRFSRELLILFGPADGLDNFGSIAEDKPLALEGEHASPNFLFLNVQ